MPNSCCILKGRITSLPAVTVVKASGRIELACRGRFQLCVAYFAEVSSNFASDQHEEEWRANFVMGYHFNQSSLFFSDHLHVRCSLMRGCLCVISRPHETGRLPVPRPVTRSRPAAETPSGGREKLSLNVTHDFLKTKLRALIYK